VRREFIARGVPEAAATKCLELFEVRQDEQPASALDRLSVQVGADPSIVALRGVVSAIGQTPAASRIRIDASLARGLSYYTGAILEIAVADLPGSLGGGGRYDGLVGMFLGRDVPACGFSLGLERILVVMQERNMFPADVARGAVDILVTVWDAESAPDAVALAADLRKSGLRAEVYPEPDKLGKQFKYASSRQVPFVAIEGGDERARGEVAIKDMRSGEQIAVKRAEAAGFVSARVNG